MLIHGGASNAAKRSRTKTRANTSRFRVRLRRSVPTVMVGVDLSYAEGKALANDVQRPSPARLGEEMQNHMRHPGHAVFHAGLFVLALRRLEGPIVEQWPSDDVLARNKSPVARVQAIVPIVPHHEVLSRRHHQVAVFQVTWETHSPRLGRRIRLRIWRNRRKLVEEIGVILRRCRLGVRLRLSYAVQDHDAIA